MPEYDSGADCCHGPSSSCYGSILVRQPGRGSGAFLDEAIRLFGAVCPDRAVGAAIIMPSVNSEAMADHLAEISTQVAGGAHAVVVCDGAGWHQRGERLPIPDNVSLLPLPGYSPELNPVENVWEYLRANKLSSRVWDSYDAILYACRDAWNFLIRDPDRIRSIAQRDWATVRT